MIIDVFREDPSAYTSIQIQLPSNSEFRVIYNYKTHVYLRLLDGKGEILGAEMTRKHYMLPNNHPSTYVFTYHGCSLELIFPKTLKDLKYYIVKDEDGFGQTLAALNSIFEKHRCTSFDGFYFGPKVVFVGSENSGKSSILRTLLNYAAKQEWRPVFADLEVELNDQAPPGLMAAFQVDQYLPYNCFHLNKLAYFFAHQNIGDKTELYKRAVKALASKIESKLINNKVQFEKFIKTKEFLKLADKDPNAKQQRIIEKQSFASGVFYNLPNELSSFDDETIKAVFDTIRPDYIVLVHNDALKSVLESMYGTQIPIIRLNKNTGVMPTSTDKRKLLGSLQKQRYFYSEWLVCVRDTIDIADLNMYRVENVGSLPLSYLSNNRDKELLLNKVDPRITDLKGNIIAVINIKGREVKGYEEIVKAEVLYLVLVVDTDGKQMTIIRPKNAVSDYKDFVFFVGSIKV